MLEVRDLIDHIRGGDGDLERDGRDGHAWMVLRFYFFSLPTAVAFFSFNFFRCAGSAGIGAMRRCAPGKCVTRVNVCQGNAGPC
jgi:hypothetical protein